MLKQISGLAWSAWNSVRSEVSRPHLIRFDGMEHADFSDTRTGKGCLYLPTGAQSGVGGVSSFVYEYTPVRNGA